MIKIAEGLVFYYEGLGDPVNSEGYYINRKEEFVYEGPRPISESVVGKYILGLDYDDNYTDYEIGDDLNAVKINMDIDPDFSPSLSSETQPGDVIKVVKEKSGDVKLYVFFPKDWDDWQEDWEEEWEDEWKKDWEKDPEKMMKDKDFKEFFVELKL